MSRTQGSKSRGKAALWVVGLAAPVAALQAGVTNYTYDELGRLVRVSDTRNGDRVYAYDPAGNRRQVIVGGAGQQPPASEPRERNPPPGSRRAAVGELPEMPSFVEDVRTPLVSFEELSSPTIEATVPALGRTKER